MKSAEIRQKFLDFFAQRGHQIVPSSSLVPVNDPTLLFTNAGMNQFKDVFLGFDQRPYSRAVSSQKCVRAGGKHNDLENVGYTARHHTFFEMLGNFSFGDYFKREAILYAWEFLTAAQWLHLPQERLWVTVYAEDHEAYELWHKVVGLPVERIIRIGDRIGDDKRRIRYASDNFWTMGDTGPCGPCAEIFYDHGESIPGGLPGTPDQDGDRYVEIWNNVFMQFNRDENGIMHPLPRPSVDTGMGLERISAIMQGVCSNYDTDLFQNLVSAAQALTGAADRDSPSLRVIADHIRSCAFLIADGVLPSNEGRGYVLRRIIRRAIRHGHQLGRKEPFFHQLVGPLANTMGGAYSELIQRQEHIEETLKQEEVLFGHTLENGLHMLKSVLSEEKKILDGATAFKLADTFGFPIDLTADICRERGMTVDMEGFEVELARQRQHSKLAEKFQMAANLTYHGPPSHFHGYDTLRCEATILALYRNNQAIGQLQAGEEGTIVLDHTPFYAESGGQAGDLGHLCAVGDTLFSVIDTQKIKADVFGHQGHLVRGQLKVGDIIKAVVDSPRRLATARNHSATHLLHAVLRTTLGTHVEQKGSLVTGERIRFDFSHPKALISDEVSTIEIEVNREIMRNMPVTIENKSYREAVQSGALALFGEKYGEEVRVIQMGDCSTELCGGTHVDRTGDIGFFKILSETGIAAGIRRIEATTGENALQQVHREEREIQQVYDVIQSQPGELVAKLQRIQDHTKFLERELNGLKARLAVHQANELIKQVIEIKGIKIITAQLDHTDNTMLREILNHLKSKLGTVAIVLATVYENKVALIAGVSADIMSKVRAGELVNFVACQVGGKGGGRADIAQAGGTQPHYLPAALASVSAWVSIRFENAESL